MTYLYQLRRTVGIALLLALAGCGQIYRDADVNMTAKQDFDALRYLGTWYEIARYPVPFQSGCVATTAKYEPINSSTVGVINTCREDALNGKVKQIEGRADIVSPGKLKVSFDGVPFVKGDYWVLWTDKSYTTAVVGVPSGKAGWILSRTPKIGPESRADAERVLRENGYDLQGLEDVPQPEE